MLRYQSLNQSANKGAQTWKHGADCLLGTVSHHICLQTVKIVKLGTDSQVRKCQLVYSDAHSEMSPWMKHLVSLSFSSTVWQQHFFTAGVRSSSRWAQIRLFVVQVVVPTGRNTQVERKSIFNMNVRHFAVQFAHYCISLRSKLLMLEGVCRQSVEMEAGARWPVINLLLILSSDHSYYHCAVQSWRKNHVGII